jgi:two-component system, NarL family, nitrate/nitrite response regulator NarL
MAKVLTADRQPLFNQALEALLTREGRHSVVGRCSLRDEIPLAVRRLQPDLLLVDAGVALSGTPTTIERALSERPGLKVLVLAQEMDLKLVVDAVSAGALGVVVKTSRPSTVHSAIESALGKGGLEPRATLPRVFRQLVDMLQSATESPVNRLSQREREVVAMLGRGWSNESIGRVLYISPHTVRTHVQNILEKLEMHSRLEAATFAMERASELPATPAPMKELG